MYFTKKVSFDKIPSLAVIEVLGEEIPHYLLFSLNSSADGLCQITGVVLE
jgi:hypothetical protein